MRKVVKAITVLRDNFRAMSLGEFTRFLGLLLFRNDEILVYAVDLAGRRFPEESGVPLVVKGEPRHLETERRLRNPAPWELQCDVYDGVRDCFVHVDGGRLGHISWLYYRGDPNRILRLADGECEVKFCLTFPEFRGRGLYPAALRAIQRDLAGRAFRRCFVCVRSDNTASIRGIEKAGFHKVGAMVLRKVMGMQVGRPPATSSFEMNGERQR